jgi:hypothetical protein
MAKETITKLIDDLDGGEAHETVKFGLDGHSYEIDLSTKNANKLRNALPEPRSPLLAWGSRLRGWWASPGVGVYEGRFQARLDVIPPAPFARN